MRFPSYDPLQVEQDVLTWWGDQRILEKLRERNKQGNDYYFLEGPPYTSGRIHLGHAWNMALKDMVLRYKRMNGFNVWDRMGYDMHGLPTEHATEKKLGISGPDEIRKFGVDKFIRECETLCKENMKLMNQDFIRLGSTLDFSDPYQSITKDFIDGEWFLIKRAHEKRRLYEGERALSWCGSCATALAKHELEYKDITDDSIYLKFKLGGEKNTYILIWTTTPWTIPLNLAAVVNGEFEYVKCKVDDEYWIVAKELADRVIKEKCGKEYEIVETFFGKLLEGKEYIPAFPDEFEEIGERKKEHKKIFTILLSDEYVHLEEGTGIVHFAPGCGDSDYELCIRNGIKPFNVIDDKGVYPEHKSFGGFIAKKDDKKFIELMENNGSLIAQERYHHSYAHCWRCRNPIIYKTTKQWFFKVEDLKPRMIEANNKIKWVPEAGYNAFNSWLENLRDNSISKQRFWGTPLPIWRNVDDEMDYIVVGSIAELEKLSEKKIDNPHKPWIDDVVIEKNGRTYKRIPDVLDVWVDAGTVSWNCLYYPQKTEYFERLFPAAFILEGKDQIRGWYNLLLVASFLAFDKPSFKSVYMHGFVTDVDGVKMSKSQGNIISPDEVINKHGADTLRYYSMQTNAGEDMNFSWDSVALKSRQLHVFWNIHKFLIMLAQENKCNPFELKVEQKGAAEKYILSRLQSTIKTVTTLFDKHHLDNIVEPIEKLFLDLSRTYIQLVRDKSSVGTRQEKEIVMATIGHVLLTGLKLFAPIVPFITEAMYLNVKETFDLEEESIHHTSWPTYDENYIDTTTELHMSLAQDVVTSSLHAREQSSLSVRWPVNEIVVASSDNDVRLAVKKLKHIIMKQVNCKDIAIVDEIDGVKQTIKVDFSKINPRYKELSPKIIEKLSVESKETLLEHINKNGAYRFVLDTVSVEIVKDDLIIEREVPHPYKAADFGKGIVYLNQTRTPELEAEGFSREIMRRVQSMRKKAGLHKPDRIDLHLRVSDLLKPMLNGFAEDIKQKVGAEKMLIESRDSDRQYDTVSEEKVKKEIFVVGFNKV